MARAGRLGALADCALRDAPLGTGPGLPGQDDSPRPDALAAENAREFPDRVAEVHEACGSSKREGRAAARAPAPTDVRTTETGAWPPVRLLADRGDPTADVALALGCHLGALAVNACMHGRDASTALAALRFALAHPLSHSRV